MCFSRPTKNQKEIANLGVEKSFFLLLFRLETKLLAKFYLNFAIKTLARQTEVVGI